MRQTPEKTQPSHQKGEIFEFASLCGKLNVKILHRFGAGLDEQLSRLHFAAH